jgi:hypothetical protein
MNRFLTDGPSDVATSNSPGAMSVPGLAEGSLGLQQVVDGSGDRIDERLGVSATEDGDPVDVVEQVADDSMLGEQLGDGGGADVVADRPVLLVAVGVGAERFLRFSAMPMSRRSSQTACP